MRRTLPCLLLAAACTHSPARPAPSAGPSLSESSAPATQSTTPTTPAPAPCASVSVSKDTGPEQNPPGDIPDNTAFVRYVPPSARYSISVPEGWARTAHGDAVTFTDKYNSVVVTVVAAAQAPTVASAKAAEVPAIAAADQCFSLRDVTTVARKGGSAVLVRYRADSAPDPVTGKRIRDDVERYEFWHNGREAVLTLSGAVGADNVDPWRTVSDSFRWS